MYFASRLQAGRMLATQLEKKYRYENCAVIALNDGGVMVGAQIASRLHCILNLMLSEEINLPRETDALGVISEDGSFSYNQQYSAGEIDEMVGEFTGYIEQQKLSKLHEMNRLLGSGGLVSRDLLRGHTVILVSDGMKSGAALDVAAQFLKPIAIERLVVATPLASVQAVDKMHIIADEIYCLSVPDEYMNTDHYYDKQDIPDHDTVVSTIENIILQWK